MGAVVADDVVNLLLVLGQACNDAGLAVLDAQAQFAQASEVLWRCWDHTNVDDAIGRVVEERFAACRDHVERLTALYAWAAANYATCAVEIASRVADGDRATVPTSLPVLPSDVLGLSQIHVPRLQIPDRAVSDRWRSRLARENDGLAADHRRLVAAMAAVESPATTFDEPAKVFERQTGYLLEAKFPAALHEYGTSCAFGLAIMSVPDG